MTFQDLQLIPPILRALAEEQYTIPTPIQEQAIPPVLAGRDLLGIAQTGTGKTAAFALPTLQRLGYRPQRNRPIRALVLTPTRELALQIFESFAAYGRHLRLEPCVIFGGVPQKPQERALLRGVDILVATPGRLNDLIGQGLISLHQIEILILDEADRMLDMGFIHDVKRIIAQTPERKQTLFFSATMPAEIANLSRSILIDPVRVSITPDKPTVEKIDQTLYFVNKDNKRHLLVHLLQNPSITSALVFTRTKHGADRVVKELSRSRIEAAAIHGNKSQNARQRALGSFKDKSTRILVATDIAARGLDIDELSHVINYDLPEVSETYVHRIGRTGRAGLGGSAISFCDAEEKKYLRGIERLIMKPIPVVNDHPYPLTEVEPPDAARSNQENAPRRPSSFQKSRSAGRRPGRSQPDHRFGQKTDPRRSERN